MPTYQYACRSCDHRFEVVQGFDESALATCPACEQDQLRKLFGNVGVVFKGSGFYRNDSRSGGRSKQSGDSAAKSSTGDSGGDASADSASAGSSSTDSASTAGTTGKGDASGTAQPASPATSAG
jgi:putative FmdB family regulatory protein